MTKILVVDDEVDVRRLIEVKLKKACFEVITASDGQEGLETAIAETPDRVVLDVMMPRMDGYTAAPLIKQQVSPPPVIVMLTAKGQESDVIEGLTGGADDYIIKPFAPRELIARIQVALIKSGRKVTINPEA